MLSALDWLKKTAETRARSLPERSSASSVFSSVGSPEARIASTSARCSAMPASKAGRKCSTRIAAKSGRWYGSVEGAAKGFEASSGMAPSSQPGRRESR